MFATFLAIEDDGAVEFVGEPKLPAIEQAIRALDGVTKTLVCVEGEKEMHLDIGSGALERCVVSLTYDNQKYYILMDLDAPGDLIEVKVSGRTCKYPGNMLVPRVMALQAAKMFAEKGEADPSLPWVSTEDIPQPNAEAVKSEE